jgi:hypothetical protein
LSVRIRFVFDLHKKYMLNYRWIFWKGLSRLSCLSVSPLLHFTSPRLLTLSSLPLCVRTFLTPIPKPLALSLLSTPCMHPSLSLSLSLSLPAYDPNMTISPSRCTTHQERVRNNINNSTKKNQTIYTYENPIPSPPPTTSLYLPAPFFLSCTLSR